VAPDGGRSGEWFYRASENLSLARGRHRKRPSDLERRTFVLPSRLTPLSISAGERTDPRRVPRCHVHAFLPSSPRRAVRPS
jgi:hypothetical protein